jgi:signal peptide peptidase SppA
MKKEASSIISAIEKTPWAITPDALELILGIAQRKISDTEAAMVVREGRENKSLYENIEGIAVIEIFGNIFPRADFFTQISGGATAEGLLKTFSTALKDDSIKAILLNVDSPGGQITGINEFSNAIYNARGTKPIYAYVNGLAASAAYWIASAADKVICDATARVGSIGVVAAWRDYSEADKREGIKNYEFVSSQSPNKRLDYSTEKGKAVLQKELDALAGVFISVVARNRGVSEKNVIENFGEGGLIIASEAEKHWACDSIGSLASAIADLKFISLPESGESIMSGEKKETANPQTEDNNFSSKKLENNKIETSLKDGEAGGGVKSAPSVNVSDEAKLLASNPDLYNALILKGSIQERDRIKAIEAMKITGHSDLINEAKYTNPCTAEQLAYKIIQADNAAGRTFATNYSNDKAEVGNVTSSVNTDADNFNSDVSAIVAGAKNG